MFLLKPLVLLLLHRNINLKSMGLRGGSVGNVYGGRVYFGMWLKRIQSPMAGRHGRMHGSGSLWLFVRMCEDQETDVGWDQKQE